MQSLQRLALARDAARRRSSIYSGSAHHQAATAAAALTNGLGAMSSDGDDTASVGQVSHLGGQTFIATALYQNAVVAVKRHRSKRLNITRSLMIDMLRVRL